MEDKTKLIVLAKKELVLILALFAVSISIAFTFGFRLGKNYSFDSGPLTSSDRNRVDQAALMKAVEEENAETVETTAPADVPAPEAQKEAKADANELLQKRLYEELKKEPGTNDQVGDIEPVESSSNDTQTDEELNKDEIQGKYTIQLASVTSLNEAEEFAKGFQVRGYSPIITKVDLQSKGIRFRVSLGVFENVADAREYINSEKTLFVGQEYSIMPIQ
ncbi:MAG: SPOR domain-containing protein [Bacteriovoracaceae bacterium]